MTSKDRVLTALSGRQPDRLPYCEFGIDRAFAAALLDRPSMKPPAPGLPPDEGPFTAAEANEIADVLGLDNLTYTLRPPTFGLKETAGDGQQYYVAGQIHSRKDLGIVRLTDPGREQIVASARAFAAACGARAACLSTRAGLTPVILGMGMEPFCVALHDDLALVEELLDRYVDWAVRLAARASGLGYHVFQTSDDMAFRTGLFFSPDIFRRVLLPRYRRIADVLDIPWVFHSDGCIEPVLDDLVDLGVAAIHPVEPLAMDIVAIKRRYGSRLCLIGNVDLGLLAEGTVQDVEAEVLRLRHEVGATGGFILSSGNSLAHYLNPDNVRAMAATAGASGAASV